MKDENADDNITRAATLFPDEQPIATPAHTPVLSGSATAKDGQLSTKPDWHARADYLREDEWRTVQKLLLTLRRLALRTGLRKVPPRPAETARFLEAFAKLGRLCTGLSSQPDPPEQPNGLPIPPSIMDAVERIYGPKRSKPQPPGDTSGSSQSHNFQPSTINSQPS